jgi:hypothetical protein
MDRSPRRGRGWSACALLAVAAALLALPAAAGAVSWTPIPSGTASNITAIEYQSPSRFWFTTSAGEIYGRGGGNFVKQKAATGITLNDIEFLPSPSEVGLAVGNSGQVFRTINGGVSWTAIGGFATLLSKTVPNDCTAAQPLGDVYSVRFASPTIAYILGQGSQLARSSNASVGAEGTWVDANWVDNVPGGRSPGDLCRIADNGDNLGDAFFASPTIGTFCTLFFGEVFVTVDGLASAAPEKAEGCGNGFLGTRHLAGDPANPNRMWAVGGSSKLDGTAMTNDGWTTAKSFLIGNDTVREFSEATDIAYAGGTVLTAGTTGMIAASNDGQNFYFNDATGSLATTGWEAAALANGNDGAVGGAGGALAVTTDASNVVPPSTAPIGTGPTTPAKDTKAPETTIVKKPKKKSAKRKVKFTFTSSEPGSTFECKLDKAKKYTRCKSPLKRKLKPGKHKFSVRAIDKAGNSDATPAVWKFKITAPH